MNKWIDTIIQAPPTNIEVDVKFIDNNDVERIITDKLIPLMNGSYIYAHGDYSGCIVTAWKYQ